MLFLATLSEVNCFSFEQDGQVEVLSISASLFIHSSIQLLQKNEVQVNEHRTIIIIVSLLIITIMLYMANLTHRMYAYKSYIGMYHCFYQLNNTNVDQ